MNIEEVVKLLGQCSGAVGVLDTGGADHRFEELTLEDDLRVRVNVIWLYTKALVELLEIFFLLILIAAA